MPVENTLIILFSVATGAAITAQWLKVPYTVALVVTGMALGATDAIAPPHLTRELLFAVILPGLLFEAAFHIEVDAFVRNKMAITSLAIPGVIIAIVIGGAGTALALQQSSIDPTLTLGQGLVFGALVAATDPIAVVALFRELNIPVRLSTLIEGESLMNDGTAIVLLSLVLEAVTGQSSGARALVLQFLVIVLGGALLGVVTGLVASRLIARIDDAVIEITITMITAYGTFALAEQARISGVIATVVAAMLCGTHGRAQGMSRKTRFALGAFWEYLAFALNSVVFLLIGFEVHISTLLAAWPQILIAFFAILVARAIAVWGIGWLLSKSRERVPGSWLPVMTWGGLRGALSMVLALSLPLDFPNRDLLVTLTFGVVVLSIVVQGGTMKALLRRCGFAESPKAALPGAAR